MKWVLHLSKGPFGKCPDCGRPTFVRRSSMLYADSSEWTASPDLLTALCRDIVRSYHVPVPKPKEKLKPGRHMTCIYCRHRTSYLYWIEVEEGCVSGPFCRECLREATYELSDERGVRDDLPVYSVSSSKTVLAKARAILLVSPAKRSDRVTLKDDDAVLL